MIENDNIDVRADCDELKIRRNQKPAHHPERKHYFESVMFDLHLRCGILKLDEKCSLPTAGSIILKVAYLQNHAKGAKLDVGYVVFLNKFGSSHFTKKFLLSC